MAKKQVVWPTGTAEVRGGYLYYKDKPVKAVQGAQGVANYDFAQGGFAMTNTAFDDLRQKLGSKFRVRQ